MSLYERVRCYASGLKKRVKFASRFIRNIGGVGALFSTSKKVADAMLDTVDWDHSRTIVEAGAGDGDPITIGILDRMYDDAYLTAFESNPGFCRDLQAYLADPRFTLREESIAKMDFIADVIISSVPKKAFAIRRNGTYPKYVSPTLDRVVDLLAPDGQFVHQKSIIGGRIRRVLEDYFSEVNRRRVGARIVYDCRGPKPRRAA